MRAIMPHVAIGETALRILALHSGRNAISRRFKSATFQSNKPLSTQESKVVYRCYASHGVGYGKCPKWGAELRIRCANRETRAVKWCDGRYGRTMSDYECDDIPRVDLRQIPT
jgi:hypothetical protein